jgi:lysophospholipase L1-like esterase
MSDPSHSHDEEHHEGPIKTPKQLIVTVLLSFVVPVIAIVLLAIYVTTDKKPAAGSDFLTPESIARRIAPIGAVNLGNSGDRTENVLYRLAQAPLTRLAPEHVFLLIGTNNLGHGTSNAAETLAGVQAVAELLAAQCPKATVHIIEIFPRGEAFNAMRGDICQINQALRAWVAAKKDPKLAIHAIGDAFLSPDGSISKELMPDSLHLSARAYQMWADAIVAILRR